MNTQHSILFALLASSPLSSGNSISDQTGSSSVSALGLSALSAAAAAGAISSDNTAAAPAAGRNFVTLPYLIVSDDPSALKGLVDIPTITPAPHVTNSQNTAAVSTTNGNPSSDRKRWSTTTGPGGTAAWSGAGNDTGSSDATGSALQASKWVRPEKLTAWLPPMYIPAILLDDYWSTEEAEAWALMPRRDSFWALGIAVGAAALFFG
jgi:hypothetical protein